MASRFALLSLVSLAASLAFAACSSTSAPSASVDAGLPDAAAAPWGCGDADFAGTPLGVRCGALVDPGGHTVLLHGVNARVAGLFDVSFADGRTALEPIPAFSSEDAKAVRAAGFNALRLPIVWSGVEPTETGGFDEAYLDRVAVVVSACRAAGLYVLIDSHQDAYSKEIGEDGAPLWAIVPPPTHLLGGPLTNLLVRRVSAQVRSAFETFFGGSEDGARLRDRYAKMLAHVAARFANDDAVVGLEIFNEPAVDDAVLPGAYGPMIDAVRTAAPQKLVFFQPSATRLQNEVAPLGSGSLGRGTVYAPHVYTQALDETTAPIAKEDLRASNQAARAEAESFAAPLAITEYGFDPAIATFASYVRDQEELQDEYLASSFFWVWAEMAQGKWGFFDYDAAGAPTARPAVFEAFRRVRLERAAGRLRDVAYDADAKRFEMHFDGTGATDDANVVSVGGALASYEATCDGATVAVTGLDRVTIRCGGPGDHAVVLDGN